MQAGEREGCWKKGESSKDVQVSVKESKNWVELLEKWRKKKDWNQKKR